MTIKQALDEINATPEQKKNGLDRLMIEAKPAADFRRQIKRYIATAAAAVVTVGTAAVGVHFAMLSNQGGPISVSIGDNTSLSEEITAKTTVATTASTTTTAITTSTTAATTSATTEAESTTVPQTTFAPGTANGVSSDEPTGTATNVTLRMTGNEGYLQKAYLYYLKVSNDFLNNSDILEYFANKMSEYPMFNTDGSDHTFDSIECGTYIIAGPWISPTGDNGYVTFVVTENDSNSVISIDLDSGTVSADKIKVIETEKEEPLPESDKSAMIFSDSIVYEGEKYLICDSEDTYFEPQKDYLKDIASDDRKYRIIYYLPDEDTRVNVNGEELTRDEIIQNVLLCKHHPLGGKSNYFRIYIKESFCKNIKNTSGAMSALAAYTPYDSNYMNCINVNGENTKYGIKDSNGAPIANAKFYVYYLDHVDKFMLKNNMPLTGRFSNYNPQYCDDHFDTDKNGMICDGSTQSIGISDDVEVGFSIYAGTAAIIKCSDIDNGIDDDYTVFVYDIAYDGITLEASYPYSMFKDRIWSNSSYHNSRN